MDKENNHHARCHIAKCKYLKKDYPEALKVLAPSIEEEVKIPLIWALASQIKARLGKKEQAMEYLRNAVWLFNWGLDNLKRINMRKDMWCLCIGRIQKAAGLLGEHELLITLNKKWEKYYQSVENYFYVGIAYYNLKKYQKATTMWNKSKSLYPFLNSYIKILDYIKKGRIPHLHLEYVDIMEIKDALSSNENINDLMKYGYIRMMLIGSILTSIDDISNACRIIYLMIRNNGEWGIIFGKSLLAIDELDPSIKIASTAALTDSGIYVFDEKIPGIDNAKEKINDIYSISDICDDRGVKKLLVKATDFVGKGEHNEAIKMLEHECFINNNNNPMLVMVLAWLYHYVGREKEAEEIIETALEKDPDNSKLLLFAAEFYHSIGCDDRARYYLKQVDEDDLYESLQQKMNELISYISFMETPTRNYAENDIEELVAWVNLGYFKEYFNKDLPKKLKLLTCLRSLPVEWLDSICDYYDLPWEDLRKDREKRLAFEMIEKIPFALMIKELSSDAMDLLELLVKKDGLCILDCLEERFGSIDDNFLSVELPPSTPMGQLFYRGLIYIGEYQHENKKRKTVAIPSDLYVKVSRGIKGQE